MTSRTPDFDRVAGVYRWAEWVSLGLLLERTREQLIPEIAHCRNALVLGDGDGRFLAKFLRSNREMQSVAIDTSAAMLRRLRERCAYAGAGDRVATLQANALEVEIAGEFDVVITHFFLDCLDQAQVDTLVARVGAAVAPGTLWLVSDFAVPPGRILRAIGAVYIRMLYFAFRILTGLRVNRLPCPQDSLTGAGFARVARRERAGGLLYTELWRRLRIEDVSTPTDPATGTIPDPIPESEPAVPSLPGPDPGVFHHEPTATPAPVSPPTEKP